MLRRTLSADHARPWVSFGLDSCRKGKGPASATPGDAAVPHSSLSSRVFGAPKADGGNSASGAGASRPAVAVAGSPKAKPKPKLKLKLKTKSKAKAQQPKPTPLASDTCIGTGSSAPRNSATVRAPGSAGKAKRKAGAILNPFCPTGNSAFGSAASTSSKGVASGNSIASGTGTSARASTSGGSGTGGTPKARKRDPFAAAGKSNIASAGRASPSLAASAAAVDIRKPTLTTKAKLATLFMPGGAAIAHANAKLAAAASGRNSPKLAKATTEKDGPAHGKALTERLLGYSKRDPSEKDMMLALLDVFKHDRFKSESQRSAAMALCIERRDGTSPLTRSPSRAVLCACAAVLPACGFALRAAGLARTR